MLYEVENKTDMILAASCTQSCFHRTHAAWPRSYLPADKGHLWVLQWNGQDG